MNNNDQSYSYVEQRNHFIKKTLEDVVTPAKAIKEPDHDEFHWIMVMEARPVNNETLVNSPFQELIRVYADMPLSQVEAMYA